MSERTARALKEVENFLASNDQYKGAAVFDGSRLVTFGEINEKIANAVFSAVEVFARVFRDLKAGSPRYFVAEGEGYCISFGKYGFDKMVILLSEHMPIGMALYDVKRLAQKLQIIAEG